MDATQINALIAALQTQRNKALNDLAGKEAELAVAKDIIAFQQKKLAEANEATKEAIPA